MRFQFRAVLAAAAISLAAVGLAACGGGSSSGSTTSTAAAGSGSTVSTMSIGGFGNVLTDSKGEALYTNNRDSGTKVACTGSCASIWVPLAAPASGQPTSSDSSVQAKLGVVKTPDGTSQVTYGGKPLYTFVSDGSGQVTGNGATDQFNGTSFTWTVASTGKAPASAAGTTSTSGAASTGAGSGGGGYGY